MCISMSLMLFHTFHTKVDIWKNVGRNYWLPYYRSQWLPSTVWYILQRNANRLGKPWGWVNDDIIFIFGWTIPLRMEDGWVRSWIWSRWVGGNVTLFSLSLSALFFTGFLCTLFPLIFLSGLSSPSLVLWVMVICCAAVVCLLAWEDTL